MSSRIEELESSLRALENDLKQVQNKEAEARLAADNAIEEINQFKEEVKGILDNLCLLYNIDRKDYRVSLGCSLFFPLFLFRVGCYSSEGLVISVVVSYLPFEIDGKIV